jgi:hypothetical protein
MASNVALAGVFCVPRRSADTATASPAVEWWVNWCGRVRHGGNPGGGRKSLASWRGFFKFCETNFAARRFIGGLPPMLEPRSRDPACAGLRQAASPPLTLSPAIWRAFSVARLCNAAAGLLVRLRRAGNEARRRPYPAPVSAPSFGGLRHDRSSRSLEVRCCAGGMLVARTP